MKVSMMHGWGMALLERALSIAALASDKIDGAQSEIITIDPRRIGPETISWFRKTLLSLKANFNFSALDNPREFGKQGKELALLFTSPHRSIIGNLAPILKELELPYTVALPTSFIGTNNMFWDDKVRDILSKTKFRSTLPINILKLFEELKDSLSVEIQDNGLVSDIETDALIGLLRKVSPTLRVSVLGDLVAYAEEQKLLPEIRYFLNWEEVRKLYSEGANFVSANHGYLNLAEVTFEEALSSVKKSALTFNENQIVPINALFFPWGELPFYWEDLLRILRIELGFGGDSNLISNDIRIFSPIEINPENTPTKSLMMCRIKRKSFMGYKF